MALMRICACVDALVMDPIYELQAETLKTLANPRRLEIVHQLAAGPCTVGRLAAQLGLAQPNVSQHLALMRAAGVVEAERDGREMRYRLADADIITACGLMRQALQRRLSRFADLSAKAGSPPTRSARNGPDPLAGALLRH